MLYYHKARPKRKDVLNNTNSNITTECKECSNNKFISKLSSLLLDIKYTRIGNKFNHKLSLALLNSIPVLSIFVLLGIMTYSTILVGFGDVGVFAAESNTGNNSASTSGNGNNTSLIIDNGTASDSTSTVRGGITYSSHTVQVKADNITAYSLTINGPVGLTGGTTITGAGNKTPANMASNTWGYAFAPNTTNNESTLAYQSFNGSNQTLNSSNPSVSNYAVDFTRKLVFAVKFDQNATEGHYRANVKLNLTITPRTLITYSVTYNANGGTGTTPTKQNYSTYDTSTTMYSADGTKLTKSNYLFAGWATSSSATRAEYAVGSAINLTSSDTAKTLYAVWKDTTFPSTLTTMQEMTADICNGVGIGVTKDLTDSRDNKKYSVQKLMDGNCWMTKNLALDLTVANIAKPADSDVSSNYPTSALPDRFDTSTTNAWVADETVDEFSKNPQKFTGVLLKYEGSAYGYYYSWCAATANTCKIGDTPVTVDASGSICPKGWKLPQGGYTSNNDFVKLAGLPGATSMTWSVSYSANDFPYITLGGTIWPRAGYIGASGLGSSGSEAEYWSRTPSGDDAAYALQYFNGSLKFASSNYRWAGFNIRCVAYSS